MSSDDPTGMTDDDRRYLVERGIGITNLVPRATAKASELTAAELREGGGRLRRLVAEHRPGMFPLVLLDGRPLGHGRLSRRRLDAALRSRTVG